MDKQTWNIIQLAFGFMFIFAGFNSQSLIETTVLSSVASNTGAVEKLDGYYSLSIIYGFFTLGNFAAPPIVSAIGSKWAMTASALTYSIFLANFLFIARWSLYVTSALVGVGSAVLWTGQGHYLTLNSDSKTAGKNSGIVWAVYQTSLIEGAIFLYLVFKFTTSRISESTIRIIYAVFTFSSLLGVLILACLRSPPKSAAPKEPSLSNLETFASTFKLMRSKDMLLLSVVFIYVGLEYSFVIGVYSTCLSFTTQLNIGHEILAFNTLALGLGQIIGGASFGTFLAKRQSCGRTPVILFGCVMQLACFVLIFINIPTDAPIRSTNHVSLIPPSIPIALVCGFLLGLCDSCWNTQIYSVLATTYADCSAQAFAISKFYHVLVSCAAFFYGAHLELRPHLLVLAVSAIVATVCFILVERKIAQRQHIANLQLRSVKEHTDIYTLHVTELQLHS